MRACVRVSMGHGRLQCPLSHLTQSALPFTRRPDPFVPSNLQHLTVSGAQNTRSLQVSHTGPANPSSRHCKRRNRIDPRGKRRLSKTCVKSTSPPPPRKVASRQPWAWAGTGCLRASPLPKPVGAHPQSRSHHGMFKDRVKVLGDRGMVGARNLVESRCPLLPTGTSIWAGDPLQLYYLFPPNAMFIVVGVLFCFSLKK